ncbi:MAG: neutral zinc metallopeptidase [Bacteroidota bacterium]
MRWQGRRKSSNVEDRRGGGGGRSTGRRVGGGLGIGTILIVIFALIMGKNPADLLQLFNAGGGGAVATAPAQDTNGPVTTGNAAEDQLAEFVSVVLADTEDVWSELFPKHFGRPYQKPSLVLFSGETVSGCGRANSSTGPFYCPADQKMYIDLSFYQTLKNRFKAPGDFAMAYVLAHEVGHHVQFLLGYTQQVDKLRRTASKARYNDASVRLELMADFMAGVWAHHGQKKRKFLEEGDIEEAIRAASAVGDDNIQMQSQGYVVPESFTHGTSEQRQRWFIKGLRSGDISQGDTFAANPL